MSKSRAPLYIGLGLAAGVGYYLYTAGGDPKVAEKQLEGGPRRLSHAQSLVSHKQVTPPEPPRK